MAAIEQLLEDLAGAVLDGAPVDWADVESSADVTARPLIRHLRLVASVAQVHGRPTEPQTITWSAPSSSVLPATDRWGHLRMHERIGRGGFGEVYRAWDTRLDREVALKLLPAAVSGLRHAESAIIREGRLLARVRHPNVVTIYGAEQIGDRIGLWMEYVRGRTLEEQLKQTGSFAAADVIRIGTELCRAVSAVHAAGLLHRDIKAQNVMHADDGRIVLMDFGAGSELDDLSSGGAGTLLYLAPEILTGGAATARSDIYSLGVLLYHLATSSYPVPGRTAADVRRAHQRGERVAIRSVRPDIRPALARVIDRATNVDPERRHDTAEALGRDLRALQPRPARRVLYGLAGAAALIAAILAASELRARVDPTHRSAARRLAGFIAGAPSPLERPVIAVLPFRNVGSEPGSDLLVDSITSGVIRQLAIIDGLEVRSQASSFMLRDAARDLPQIGKRLNVNLVVEGEALVSGGTLLIKAALVPTEGRGQLWSDTIDRPLAAERDIVAVVEDLTRTIVNRLRLTLARTQRHYDTDVETLTTYLRARALREQRGARASEAIPLFKQVLQKDPAFAPALAALAVTYGYLTITYPDATGHTISPEEAQRLMEPLTVEALQIDPMLAEAHAAMGQIHAMALRWNASEASFRRAIDLDPSLTVTHSDFALSTLTPWGRLDESIALLEGALRTDPLSLDLRRVLAHTQLRAGRYDDAIESSERVLAVDPGYPFASLFRARALTMKGRLDEAREALRFTERPERNETWVAYLDAVTGRRAEAERAAERAAALPQRQAMIYAALGDLDRAWAAMDRLAAMNPVRAAAYLTYPELAVLRGDPRYDALRRKLRIPD